MKLWFWLVGLVALGIICNFLFYKGASTTPEILVVVGVVQGYDPFKRKVWRKWFAPAYVNQTLPKQRVVIKRFTPGHYPIFRPKHPPQGHKKDLDPLWKEIIKRKGQKKSIYHQKHHLLSVFGNGKIVPLSLNTHIWNETESPWLIIYDDPKSIECFEVEDDYEDWTLAFSKLEFSPPSDHCDFVAVNQETLGNVWVFVRGISASSSLP